MTAPARSANGARRKAGRRGSAAPAKKTGGPSAPDRADGSPQETVVYVYGIFPGDINLDTEAAGVGDPPGKVRIVRAGDIAALVSDVSTAWSLGSARDLTTHKEILDASATAVPVLPMRFGAMLADDEAVMNDLLAANHDLFAAALQELDGLVQYVVKGRYREEAILREILSEDRTAARLSRQLRGASESTSHAAKIRLGEMLSRAVTAKREQDTRALTGRVGSYCTASAVREPAGDQDAVHMALLVKSAEMDEFERAVDELAREWAGRVDLRLLGPMAAYDFVAAPGSGA